LFGGLNCASGTSVGGDFLGLLSTEGLWTDRRAQGTGAVEDDCGLDGEEDKSGCEQAGQAALGRWAGIFVAVFW